jgi:carbamoyltransferase
MLLRKINTRPSRRELSTFGLVFLGGMLLIGLVQRYHSGRPDLAVRLWIAGGTVFVLSFVPVVGRALYIAWMALGVAIGAVTSPVVLVILYAVGIVPVGLVQRLAGRDRLERRLDSKASSYWEDLPRRDDPSRYLRQY